MSTQRARVFPVIHVETLDQDVVDVRVAADCGLHRVFLIDHDADDERLADAVAEVRSSVPQM
ncbi:MAG: hypothetical protein NTX29_10545 [Actinobacteria bacterium]|nr:hypothetical protein [Actinomycetota bacterium]